MASSLSCDAFMLLRLLIYFFSLLVLLASEPGPDPLPNLAIFPLVGVWRTFGLAASLVKLSVWQCCGGALTAVHR